jgi:hypothetical protein
VLNYTVKIAETPIAGIPVMVNTQAQITDDNGAIAVSMNSGQYYAITSGLSAISFASLYDSGVNFINRGDQVIEATRLVSVAGPACRVVVGDVPSLYFSTYNSTDMTHTVSRIYKANRIYSVTGGASPPDYFPPGTSGFSIPESHFTQNDGVTGVWNFLGQSVTITSDIKMCADTGTPNDCQVLSQAALRTPIDATRVMVLKLSQLAADIAKRAKSTTVRGKMVSTFLTRGANALAALQSQIAPTTKGTTYVCATKPAAGCTSFQLTMYKQVALKSFTKLFARPVATGLESIPKMAALEGRKFKANVLDKLPDSVWICPSPTTSGAK